MRQNIGRWESELLNARPCETYGINFDQITSNCDFKIKNPYPIE